MEGLGSPYDCAGVLADSITAKVTETDRLSVFCREQHPRLIGLLSLYCGDRLLAEELAQEALLRVCLQWEQVSLADDPQAWVTTVALKLARSQFRSRDAKRRALRRLTGHARRVFDESDGATATGEIVAHIVDHFIGVYTNDHSHDSLTIDETFTGNVFTGRP